MEDAILFVLRWALFVCFVGFWYYIFKGLDMFVDHYFPTPEVTLTAEEIEKL